MYGALPKHTVAAEPPKRWHKRLWTRFTASPHIASPPPRLLLVALLSAQILILALVRVLPGSLWPVSSPPTSAPLVVGAATQVFLKVSRENDENLSRPAEVAHPSEPQTTSDTPILTSGDPSSNVEKLVGVPDKQGEAEDRPNVENAVIVPDEQGGAEDRPNVENDVVVPDEQGGAGDRPNVENTVIDPEEQGGFQEQSSPDSGSLVAVAEELTQVWDGSSQCEFGRIFVYDLPPIFNYDILANCSALNPWIDVCHTLANGGLGMSLGDGSPLGQNGSWYNSDQFTAEVVFHNRLLQHPCVTDKPELATGFYVPFYAGLDVGRYLWLPTSSAQQRDQLSKQLLEWLDGQKYWRRNGGWDHFLMIGRITWDFRRSKDLDWGSGFFYTPPMQNTTRLLIERNPWDEQEMAVPYPTNFHPQSEADLTAWQDYLRSVKRSYLFSFAGAPRARFPNDFRAILLEQCQQAERCKSLDCTEGKCDKTQSAMDLFLDSVFCLQPRGDSFTRRSTFDCLLAGAIPVFFWHRSAYMQYKWHLPADESSYSVFIPNLDMRNGTVIEEVLKALTPKKVKEMQEVVIEAIPRLVYAASGDSLKGRKDAFDVAIEGVLKRFRSLGLSSGK